MSKSKYVKVFTGNFIIVQRIIFDLGKMNIIPVVKDPSQSARLAGFGSGHLPGFQEVYVNEDELDEAIIIIQEISSKLSD